MKPANLLFFCYYFPPLGMGGTQRSAKFAKYLPQCGWLPHVVTVKDVAYYAYDYSLLEELKECSIYRTESFDPLRLLARFKKTTQRASQPSNSSQTKGTLSLINDFFLIPDSKILWLPFAIAKSIKIIRQKKVKIVLTTSPPHSSHIGGLILKLFTSVKWVADFRDDWTGGESQACPTAIHYAVHRFLEKLVLKKADNIIGMCDKLTNSLMKKSGTNKSNFSTITNGYDSDDFKSWLDLPLNDKFTITHCGSISRVSNPEPFLAGLKLFVDQHQNMSDKLCVQFIGADIYGLLPKLIDLYGLKEIVQHIPYVPHQQAIEKIMTSHLLLITIIKKTTEEIITGKIFEYLGSGKPILLISSGGEVASMIASSQRGSVVHPEQIAKISLVLQEYFRLFENGRWYSYQPLEFNQYDRFNLTKQLAGIFRNLIRSKC
jgi:glycosyltransferase involved in cell wall biosynthesis